MESKIFKTKNLRVLCNDCFSQHIFNLVNFHLTKILNSLFPFHHVHQHWDFITCVKSISYPAKISHLYKFQNFGKMERHPQSYRPVYPCPHSPAELLAARAPPCLHWCHGASYCPSHCCAVSGGWTGTSRTVSASPSGSPVQETWWIEKLLTKVYYVGICEIRQQIQIHVNINLKEMKHLDLNFKINNQDLIKKKKRIQNTHHSKL